MHVTASRWWQRRRAELAPNTRLDYKWRLDYALRFLARETTAQLEVHRVHTFRGELEAADLSPRGVNMVLDLLAQVLDDAVEYGLLEANLARGKRRRLKVPKSSRSFLEPDMVVDLLDVAGPVGAWPAGAPALRPQGVPRDADDRRTADLGADRQPARPP